MYLTNKFGKTSKIWFKSCEEGREKFQGSFEEFISHLKNEIDKINGNM